MPPKIIHPPGTQPKNTTRGPKPPPILVPIKTENSHLPRK